MLQHILYNSYIISANTWRRRELVAGLLKGHHKKTRIIKMMKADGTLASNQEESAKFFKDHFEKNVFNRNEESSYDDYLRRN
jgi:hypothetical protein